MKLWALQIYILALVSSCGSQQPAVPTTSATPTAPVAPPLASSSQPPKDQGDAAARVQDTAGATSSQQLIGVYTGTLPCADCSGTRTELSLFARSPNQLGDATYKLKETYLGTRDGDRAFESAGRWTTLRGTATDLNATVYQLNFDKPDAVRNFLRVGEDELRLLDRGQHEMPSQANLTLRRTPARSVGSYRSLDAADPAARAAAVFAVDEQSMRSNQPIRLLAVSRAEQQVVAGMNYRLCLEVNTGGGPQAALAIVYHNLRGQYLLTSWELGQC